MVAFAMMEKYGGVKKINKVIEQLYEAVGEKRDLRHYFFNIKLENLIRDQLQFHAYSMRSVFDLCTVKHVLLATVWRDRTSHSLQGSSHTAVTIRHHALLSW